MTTLKTLKFTNKDTTEIQILLKKINWLSVEFKTETTYENIKEITINKEIRNEKSKRTTTFFVDNKKVQNHDRFIADEEMIENFLKSISVQTCTIKYI